ncbi:hypothetical protein B0H66DRAFT_563724 [Apodospora peruviana]|uniref:Uncharacterized protein n=1 Tax=Apodospora peruviana TaxID=516989 RepID=A0AAE0M1P8_9PEZI|nr:hypothetical protein B0H66DRAFT_563724 [Apodospora peruviana]
MAGNGTRLALNLRPIDDVNYADYWQGKPPALGNIPTFKRIQLDASQQLKQAALHHDLTLGLSPGDCVTSDGVKSCEATCSDPTNLFTPANLRTCLLLASAALLVQNGSYAVNTADSGTAFTISTFDVPDLANFDGSSVLSNITKCISESCNLSKLGTCSPAIQTLSNIIPINTVEHLYTLTSIMGEYCSQTNFQMNGDIAGPGVVLSYMIQFNFCLLLFALLKFSTTWTRRLFTLLGRRDQGICLQNRLASSRLAAAAVSSLVEFQEVQTYLVASLQLATLVSFNPGNAGTSSANNDSFGEAVLNSSIVALLSLTSMSCVLLTQCALQRAGMYWWYTFAIMTLTLLLALVIYANAGSLMPSADDLWDKFKGDAALASCGGNPSPMTFCPLPAKAFGYLLSGEGSVENVGYLVVTVSIQAWLGLLVTQLCHTVPERFPGFAVRVRKLFLTATRRKCFGPVTINWKLAYWAFIQVFLAYMVGNYIATLTNLLYGLDLGEPSAWSFGQLIAFMLWWPVIAKFVYFSIWGIKEGFEKRMASKYFIMERRQEVEEEEHDDGELVTGSTIIHRNKAQEIEQQQAAEMVVFRRIG